MPRRPAEARPAREKRKKQPLGGPFTTKSLRAAIPKRFVDPRALDRVVKAAADAPPLLLLPLRLEYRVMEKGTKLSVVDAKAELAQMPFRTTARGPAAPVSAKAATQYRREVGRLRKKAVVRQDNTLPSTEIWFRWYPDEGFAERGIALPSTEELAALSTFEAAIGPRQRWNIGEPGVSAAWQSFAGTVAPARAVHLLRSRGRTPVIDTLAARMGRIAALPQRVALFAVDGQGNALKLVEGAEIPQAAATEPGIVSYTPVAWDPGGWLNSFGTAILVGMGAKISDPALVQAALQSEWIIAVGMHATGAVGEMKALLQDAIANGNFALVDQDTPTNSGPGIRSIHLNPRSDRLGFLTAATELEQGTLAQRRENDATLLAQAFGLPASELQGAVNAGNQTFVDARAMLRVIGPTLLDGAPDGIGPLAGVDEDSFIEALAGGVSARGPLSAVRFGRNPFGVLPITSTADFVSPEEPRSVRFRVHEFLKRYALSIGAVQAELGRTSIPTLSPDDPAASDKLSEILQRNPVSRRIDVGDVGSSAVEPLGCDYVSSNAHPAGSYLNALRTSALENLPDPLANDRSWPLLYRLARMALVRNTEVQFHRDLEVARARRERRDADAAGRVTLRHIEELPLQERLGGPAAIIRSLSAQELAGLTKPPLGLSAEGFARLRSINAGFAAALEHLEAIANGPDGDARLESLLMETIDLFQSRVDCWPTGLAYARLVARQRSGPGLRAGYYGLLHRLRAGTAADAGDGYVQAPTLAQANTAAVLRSAHRRHRAKGVFAIDLPSRRVRRALSVLRLLRQGLSPSEVLGLRGYRWLSARQLGLLQYKLHEKFPLMNRTPPESKGGSVYARPEPVQTRLFDGMAFIGSALSDFSAAEQTDLNPLQAELKDGLDALNDLILCEAVHLRAIGQVDAANAWLRVMSGETVPGEPSFLRTQRQGHGSNHRVSVLIPHVAAANAGAVPRETAEPSLAAFAARVVGLGPVTLQVAVQAKGGTTNHVVSPAADLGMTAIDLVIGGESELRVRLRHHLVMKWFTDAAMIAAHGALPPTGVRAHVEREAVIAYDPAAGQNPLAPALDASARVRALVQKGRPLEPADLAAAADPASPMTEAEEARLTHTGVVELSARAAALSSSLSIHRGDFRSAYQAFLTRAREARRLVDVQADAATVQTALVQAELARVSLAAAGVKVSRYAEPDGLQLLSTDEAIVAADQLDEAFAALDERLGEKHAVLDAAVTVAATIPQTRVEARTQLNAVVKGIRDALDGEALPLCPPIERVAATDPVVDPAISPGAALALWGQKREGVARALQSIAGLNAIQAHPVAAAATDDEPAQDADTRTEDDAPRSRHYGTLLGDTATVTTAPTMVGFVSDEWVTQRPSRNQPAALAINKDSPQSEPPHCLLLCTPPRPNVKQWTTEHALGMVQEVIKLMLVRGLTTDDKPTPGAFLPSANQVAFAAAAGAATRGFVRRIPMGRYKVLQGTPEIAGMVRVQGNQAVELGVAGIGINEITGHHALEE